MSNSTKVEMWSVDKPIPYTGNSRMLSPKAVDKVAASIKEFGFRQPIVVDAEGVIIVGHTRLLAAKKLGLKEMPVIVADNLTPAQVKLYRLADNRTAQESSWDYELLAVELEALSEFPIDISLSGFDSDEISGMILDEPEIREYDADISNEREKEETYLECPSCHHRWIE
jgi:ParB-like chromosome segregation protein Spo0J